MKISEILKEKHQFVDLNKKINEPSFEHKTGLGCKYCRDNCKYCLTDIARENKWYDHTKF